MFALLIGSSVYQRSRHLGFHRNTWRFRYGRRVSISLGSPSRISAPLLLFETVMVCTAMPCELKIRSYRSRGEKTWCVLHPYAVVVRVLPQTIGPLIFSHQHQGLFLFDECLI